MKELSPLLESLHARTKSACREMSTSFRTARQLSFRQTFIFLMPLSYVNNVDLWSIHSSCCRFGQRTLMICPLFAHVSKWLTLRDGHSSVTSSPQAIPGWYFSFFYTLGQSGSLSLSLFRCTHDF